MAFLLTSQADIDDDFQRVKGPAMFCAGLVLIMFQIMTTIGVLSGTYGHACMHSDMCERGSYCIVGGMKKCASCGGKPPLEPNTTACDWTSRTVRAGRAEESGQCFVPLDGDRVSQLCANPQELPGWDIDFAKTVSISTIEEWCNACVIDLTTGTYDQFTTGDRVADNILSMGLFDKVAGVFAAYVVALTVTSEIKVRNARCPRNYLVRCGGHFESPSRYIMHVSRSLYTT